MNQLHLFRLAIPMLKPTFRLFQHQQPTTQINKNHKNSLFSTLKPSENELPSHLSLPEQPSEHSKIQDKVATETEQQSEQLESQKEDPTSPSLLKKNFINDRIKTTQYEANNPCEDSIVCQQLKSLNAYTVSIFDGHGGPELAEYSKQKINSFIDIYIKEQLNKSDHHNVGQLLKDSLVWSYKKIEDTFFEIYEQHLKLGNKKIRNVGTCGITAIIHNDIVYVGNSGDSMGMFILEEGRGNTLMRTEKINQRLSLSNQNERQRIKQKWKDIDQDIISEQTNNCYYLKGRLQPTRTIGDYYLKKQQYYNGQGQFKGPYINCQPDVNQFKLTKAHKYMVLASDGVWDVLSRNQVMKAMMTEKEIDLNKTCYEEEKEEQMPFVSNVLESILRKCGQAVGKEADELKKMQLGRRRNYHDDITIAVINLSNQL